jgi:hypothetical protein
MVGEIMTSGVGREMTIDEKMDDIRIKIKDIAKYVDFIKGRFVPETPAVNVGEVMANLTLAYRHLEDASMRIGKVKQHLNGGESVYDKNVVGSK